MMWTTNMVRLGLTSVLCALWLTVGSAAEQTSRPAARPDDSGSAGPVTSTPPSFRVTGPLAVKEMMEALVAEFSPPASDDSAPGGGVRMDYARNDSARGAAGALVAGRDFVLTLGKLGDGDIPVPKDRWSALAVREHVVAVRAVAIVVHEQNPVESLTLDQVAALFSGKVRDWSSFDGPAKAMRRHGLALAHPQTALFHAKVLPAAGCRSLTRWNTSAEVLAAVAVDPLAIGFMDTAALALAASDSAKTVALEPAPGGAAGKAKAANTVMDDDDATDTEPVSPHARTIRDGTYPLAAPLVLYVSSEASSQAAREFVEFLRTGKGDEVFRRHNFMPMPRADAEEVVTKTPKTATVTVTKTSPASLSDTEPLTLTDKLSDAQLAKTIADNPNVTSITYVGSRGGRLFALRLERLPHLQQLNLIPASNIRDLSPLAKLTNLRVLVAPELTVKDLSGLSGLTNLTRLDLSGAKNLSNIRALSQLTELRSLDLSGCTSLTDLTPLAGLSNLNFLSLSGCKGIRDITPLTKLPGLSNLNLGGCDGIRDFSVLEKMSESLRSLDLSGCTKLTDLTPLSGLRNLDLLNLTGCKGIRDITPLTKLPRLSNLSLGDCDGIRDFSVLEKMPASLRSLNLSRCRKLPVRVLGTMTHLQELHLRGCDDISTKDLQWLDDRLKPCKVTNDRLGQR